MTSELFKNTELTNREISQLTMQMHGCKPLAEDTIGKYRMDRVADPKIKHLVTLMVVLGVEQFKWNAGTLNVKI